MTVAVASIIGTKMCINGDAQPGVISPECLDPVLFFEMAAHMGFPVNLEETVIKKAKT